MRLAWLWRPGCKIWFKGKNNDEKIDISKLKDAEVV